MKSRTLLVTGSSGLIGSEMVDYFSREGWSVHGIDNNMRADFFGPEGDTRWNQRRLLEQHRQFRHHEIDIRRREAVQQCVGDIRPDLVVHAAAQPSHDLAASRPFEDFDVNAGGTLNLLEAVRRDAPETVFVYLSTNKVYGDRPNTILLRELRSRWAYADSQYEHGIPETFPIDQSLHSLFGASKVAADVLVQEYGRYFGLRSCCLRGGCLTGPNHSGVQLHGFLSYLVKCNLKGRRYTVFGYQGKQVRDNIHAFDVARFVDEFHQSPRCGEVYNIGGGADNSCSILEAFELVENLTGRPMLSEYTDQHRAGDHICYVSDLRKIKTHLPRWNITRTLEDILREIVASWRHHVPARPLPAVKAVS